MIPMKQRISVDDLKRLDKKQCANLRAMWTPMRYQIALATICTNAETDAHSDIEFCVGGVFINLRTGKVTIKDLHATEGYMRLPLSDDEGEDGDEPEMVEPASFEKEECLPLLNIGEMIDLMNARNFRGFHFYLLAGTGTTGAEVGNFKSTIKDKILTEGFESSELCDVLWEMIVDQL